MKLIDQLKENKKVQELLKHLLRESTFLPNAFNLSQDPKRRVLLWFYNLANEQFEYSTTAINHSEIARDKKLILDNNWIKGRVFRYEEKVYLIAYTETFLHNRLNLNHLINLVRKVRSVIKEPLDYFVDDLGNRIDEKILKQ